MFAVEGVIITLSVLDVRYRVGSLAQCQCQHIDVDIEFIVHKPKPLCLTHLNFTV